MNEKINKKGFGAWFRDNWKNNALFSTGIALIVMVILQTLALGFNYASFGEWFGAWINNWMNILRNNSSVGIIALGMTFVIISGGIDLAVGSTLVAVGAITMTLIDAANGGWLGAIGLTGAPAYIVAILISVAVGIIFGGLNGLMVTAGKIPPFIATLGAIILGLGTHEQESALRENKTETSAKDVFKVLTQNDQLMWTAIAYLVYGIGINIVNNFNLYYFIYVIGDATKFSILGVINTVIGLVAVALFPALTAKFSRRKLFFASIAIMLVALLIYAGSGTNVTMALIGAGLFALPQPLIFLVVLMTITDSVEYGQLKIGHRDEAVCLCVRPLVDKFAGAVSSGIIGLVAVWVGMTGGASAADIKPDALFHFQIVMFAAPIVLMVIASFIYRAKVTLTEAEHARIVRELEEKWEDLSK